MMKLQGRGPRAGSSLLEVTVSAGVLTVGLCGLVAATGVSWKLEQTNRSLERAAATASAAIEDVRAAGRSDFDSMRAARNAQTTVVDGAADAKVEMLRTTVSEDPNDLSDADGMWTSGATAPNFYFVRIGASSNAHVLANRLGFQTYVTDRQRLIGNTQTAATGTGTGTGTSGTGTSGTGTSGTTDPGTTDPGTTDDDDAYEDLRGEPEVTSASGMDPMYTNLTVTGTSSRTITFDLTNRGQTTLKVTGVYLNMQPTSKTSYLKVAKSTVWNNTKKTPQKIDVSYAQNKAIAINPGISRVTIKDTIVLPAHDDPLVLTFTFDDGSAVTWEVPL